MNSEYHIDVTEEEDLLFRDEIQESLPTKRYPNNKLSWIIVTSAHFCLIGAVVGLTTLFAKEPADVQQTIQPSSQKKLETQEKMPLDRTWINADKSLNAEPIRIQEKSAEPKLTYTYTVKSGDTVHSISKKYKLNVRTLIKLNDLKNPNKIVPGQILKFM